MAVSWIAIALSALSCVVGIVIPTVLYAWLRRRGADALPFLVGCVVVLLIVYVLEPSVHDLVFKSNARVAIEATMWSFALYGGLVAGVFEELGRFVAFKTVLRNRWENNCNALMYGAGHGGSGAALVLIAGTLGNLAIESSVSPAHAGEYLQDIVEQIIAVTFHMSLSVLVWFAAKDRNRLWLLPTAIFLHATAFMMIYLIPILGLGPAVSGLAFVAYTAAVAYFAWRIWKQDAHPFPQSADVSMGR